METTKARLTDSVLYSKLKELNQVVGIKYQNKFIKCKIDDIKEEDRKIIVKTKNKKKTSKFELDIVNIKEIVIFNKEKGKELLKEINDELSVAFFNKFINKPIFVDYVEKGKIATRQGKFLSFLKYQIAIETPKGIHLLFKIHYSSFSFFKKYPKKLIKFDKDNIDTIKAGEWRKDFNEIQQIFKEEIKEENKPYEITLALKDGRDVTGYLFKKYIKLHNIRLFANKDRKGNSIFIFTHSIADVLKLQ